MSESPSHAHAYLLLGALLSSVAIAPVLDLAPLAQLAIAGAVTVPVWFSASVRRESGLGGRATMALGALLGVAIVAYLALRSDRLLYVTSAVGGLFYAVGAAQLLLHAFAGGADRFGRLLDGVNAYLLIGFAFVALYAFIDHATGGAFRHDGKLRNQMPWGEIVYFSFATLTTTGYGDVTPIAPAVRGLASLEQLTGVLFTATLISRIVGLSTKKNRQKTKKNEGG